MDRKIFVAAVVATLALSIRPLLTAQEPQPLLTENEVIELIKHSKSNLKGAAAVLDRRGVDFDMDSKTEKKLRKAGADGGIIQDVSKAGPTGRASQKAILATATGAQLQVTPRASIAFQTIQYELNPDRRLVMVDEFKNQFPNSQILSHVYAQGAKAYQGKGDLNKTVEYGEKALKLDPENLAAQLLVAVSISHPSMLRGSETQKNVRRAEAESDAKHALKLLEGISKHGAETDEQFQMRESMFASDARFALGMVALLKGDSAKAVEEFKGAIDSTASPTAQYYYRLGDASSSVGKNREAIEVFKKASELGKGTVMEESASKQINELIK